jgi:hypothetical protein
MTTPSPSATPATGRHPDRLPPPDSVLATVRQLAEQQPALSEGGIRWSIFHSENNGLADSGAVVRVGRRVLIDPAMYMAWMRSNPTMSPPKPKAGEKVTPRARKPKASLPRPVVILDAE